MDGSSFDVRAEQLKNLKSLFPEVVSEDKIDWERLRATLGEDVNISNERYVLNWAGKSDAFRTLQTGTTATLAPAKEESINFDTTDNIFIEGENLEVLKVMQKAYFGKIKCIIIDPPYNTGNDSFIYPDRFSESKEEYMKRVGDKDEEGYLMKEGLFRKNSKENGQYHSNWLSMMYPRLFLARNLLRDDGVIFVHIDDNEVHNLRLLMNEIFGEENFVSIFPWRKRTAKSDVPFGVSQDFEWVIAFAKANFQAGIEFDRKYYYSDDYNEGWRLSDLTTQRTIIERPNSNFIMINPKDGKQYPPNPNRVWGVTKNTFDEYYNKGKIVFPNDYSFLKINIPAYRVFETEDKAKNKKKYGTEDAIKIFSTFLPSDIGRSENGNKESIELLGEKVFSYPKPVALDKHFINSLPDDDFIILDFFAGSGTTAHAVLELNKEDGGNRKFILVQLPEKTDENSDAYKAGYKTIADICKERIRRVIKKIEEERKPKDQQQFIKEEQPELDLGFKVFKLKPSNFKQWRTEIQNAEELELQLEAFTDPVKPEAEEENMLFELLLKSGYDLNSKIEVKNIGNSRYFLVNSNELAMQLSGSPEVTIKDILSILPKKVIILDRLFENNDQLKTNTFLQFKDAGVDFRTV